MYAYVLGGLALLILIVGCLNFANLAVGRSLRRSTEIGVRKALGAHRSQLARQFLAEALLASGMAAALGAVLAAVALPAFNAVIGRDLSLPVGDAPLLAAGFLVLLLLTTVLSGSYPAFVLSRFDPSDTLQQRARFGVSGGMATGMVVVQFALAVILVASGFVMRAQMQHVQNQDLGYEPAGLATLDLGRGDGEQILERLREQLDGQSSIEHLAATDAGLSRTTVTAADAEFTSAYRWATPGLLETQRLRLLQGRFLSDDRGADLEGNNIVVNEAFVQSADLDAPLGARVTIDAEWNASIVGVVADYHYRSLHTPINPMILHHANDDPSQLWVRMKPDATSDGLAVLERAWRATAPLLPFDYAFESQRIEQQYRTDRRWLQIVGVAAGLALFVALLGLIGLATLTVTEREKEIGIRKALGATAAQVVLLLSGSVARLVGVAFVLGAPAAYLVTRPWIESFAVQVPTQPALYGAAGLITLTVALAAVSLHAYRATRIDPATTLRKE